MMCVSVAWVQLDGAAEFTFGLGRAYEQKQMYPQAITAFEKTVAVSHEASAQVASLAAGLAAAGKRNEAMAILSRLIQQSSREYVPAYAIAEIYAALRDKTETSVWLEKAFQDCQPNHDISLGLCSPTLSSPVPLCRARLAGRGLIGSQ